jgi:hypothetical protein
MIVRGAIFRGLNFIGKRTLASIGKLIFWYDYRLAVTLDSSDNVISLDDLSPNSLNLFPERNDTKLSKNTNGIGTTNPSVIKRMRFILKNAINVLHNGNAWAYFLVGKWDKTTSPFLIFDAIFTGALGSQTGMYIRIETSVMRVENRIVNGSGTILFSTVTPVDSIPDNSEFFLEIVFYGTGVTNGFRIRINGVTVHQSTRTSSSWATGPSSVNTMYASNSGSNGSAFIKTHFAYDLTGKTQTEINSLVGEARAKLKEDSEYSSITL